MPTLNRVQLIGRLGNDPESRFTTNGKKVTHFSIAVSQTWKTGDEPKEHTEWVNIESWGRLAEVCQDYLRKGSLIYVDGRLKTDRYEERGETKYYTKVVANVLQFLDKKHAEEPMIVAEEEVGEFEMS
jgi:single-strand DNA-binding protein